ncbi:MAG: STAS domain-containing protein [Pseudomonadota bacterium]
MNIPVQLDAGKARINLPRSFDVSVQGNFRQACADALSDDRVTEIEVDFNDVHYIDSSALGGLLLLRERAERAARSITITKCQPEVMKILAMANFHRIFTIA